ncbi:MAG: hypothetical protein Q8903_08960, partial [Bacteroidota bacterium]|nr:hypothetical protein [Bacteroidota bacterium]
MKHLLQLLIIIFVLSVNLLAQKQFEIEAVIVKDTFLVGEEIDLGLTLTNITDTAQHIIAFRTIDVQIFDSNGDEVKYNNVIMGMAHCFLMSQDEIKPGESDYRLYYLMDKYGNIAFNGAWTYYLESGNYKIKVSVTSSNNFREEKIIPFRINKPTGEELTFFNSFQNILSPVLTPKYDKKLFIEQLQALHKAYPNSVYSPILL